MERMDITGILKMFKYTWVYNSGILEFLYRQNARIKDVSRIFFCHHPLQEVEAGEQIGGGYGCCGFTGVSASYINHVGSLRAPFNSRRVKEKSARRASWERKKECRCTSFKNMSKEDLVRESKGCYLPTDCLLKPVLEAQLKGDLKGIQWVPALSFPAETTS